MFNKLSAWFSAVFAPVVDNTLNLPETKLVYLARTTETRFKPFYIHRQFDAPYKRGKHHARGFTVYIEPGKDDRTVAVRIAWCSGKDEFIKKIGRAVSRAAQPEYINPRDVPNWLAEQDMRLNSWSSPSQFFYVLKYLL